MKQALVVYGSTGHAQAFVDLMMKDTRHFDCEIVAYIDDYRGDKGESLDGAPIISFATWSQKYKAFPVFVTIGDAKNRRRLVELILEQGGVVPRFPIVNEGVGRNFVCGESTFVCFPVYIGPNVTVGSHVHLQPMLHLGHDCVLGDYVTISAAHIAGNVHIEDDVFVGMGATILHGSTKHPIIIGRGAIVGAGAVVTKSVRPRAKVLGNPAEELRDIAARRRRSI